jgi:hypothetical protein
MEIHEEWASGKVYLDMSEEKSGELKKIPQLAV